MKRLAAASGRRDLVRFGIGVAKLLAAGAGHRIARGTMPDATDRRPPTLGLIGDAIAQASRLFSSEIILAKTEVGEKMAAALTAVASIVGAATFLIVAMIFLLQALVEWLVEHGWRSSLASLLVGCALAVVAIAAIMLARSRLTLWRLVPSRTLNQALRAVAALKGPIKGHGR